MHSKKCSHRFIPKANFKIFFLLIIILMMSTAVAQWNTQSPSPTHLEIHGISAPASNRVFIATSNNFFDNGGSLFESNDGGTSWVQRNIPVSLNDALNGIYFLDSQNGWTYGNDNYRTTDGGTNWVQLPFLGSTSFMKFYTTAFGFAAGNFGRRVSHDGGASWVESPNGMFAFDFTNDLTALGASDDGIYRTANGGAAFTQVYTGAAKAVQFLSSSTAVAIANNMFIRSTDAGITWSSVSSADNRTRLTMISDNIVLAWGRSGTFPNFDDRIFRSTDAGQTWTDIGTVIPSEICSFTSIDLQTAVASDRDGNMYRSSDAGLTWLQTFSSPGPGQSYFSSATPGFVDSQTGYFGYGPGFLIKTTDGGASWFQISSGTGTSLNDIARFANGNMIAVGENGIVLTSNGLSPWIQQNRFTSENLTAVQVIGTSEALAINKEGQVYQTTDGGINWTAMGIKPPFLNAKDLHFTNFLDGWVIGQGSIGNTLFHTTDGGNSWAGIPGFGGSYTAVDFEGVNGWAMSVGERFYRSVDNGATWIQEELPGFPTQISDLDFFDANIGYAVGWGGYAARTSDGGVTWEVLPTPNNSDRFTGIYLIGPNEMWLSTNDDAAYYTANGGQNWAILEINSSGFGSFNAIAANPAGDAWTVGYQGYIEHFSGPPPPPLNQPPNAFFEFNAAGLTVSFTDLSSDPDGSIVSWLWNFGDSATSTEQNPTHTFPAANTYHVRLTVTDNEGATGSALRFVVAQPGPGGTFGNFTEVTPLDSIFVTPQDEDFWVITTAPADYDGDGDLDIAVLGYYVVYNQSVQEKLVLLRNEGASDSISWSFTYIDIPLGTLSAGKSDLAWGDLDNDGDLDLVVGTDGNTVIYRNDSGTLTLSDTELPGYYEDNFQADFDLRSITLADVDNDGDLDILIPSVYEDGAYRTALMRNDGFNGTGGWIFTEVNSGIAPTTHAQSAWADFDGDQDLDLLLVNMSPTNDEGFIRIYRNDGNGVFTGQDILGGMTIEHGEAQWGDYDADGDLDILVAGHIKEANGTYNMVLRLYRNEAGNFVPEELISCISCDGWVDLTAATWADYDSDGDMDILVAGTYNSGTNIEGRARVYTNDNGVFTPSESVLPAPRASGSRGGTFSWFDIDGDGDLDYFIAGQYFVPGGNNLVEAQMHVYRNDAADQNSPPTEPTGLNATVQADNSVILKWTPSSDDHTPAPAITYEVLVVRKGTHNPPKIGNFPKEVSVPTRLPEPGNISAVTEWLLTGLEDGYYEWMLRAVDAAYLGSFVATGEFSIGVTSTGNENDNLPISYSVEQNYPNPFNPATVIKYAIPAEGLVTIKIYNALGEEVKALVNEIKQAGNYQVTFDASGLSSGVYFYRINSGKFTETKKMILAK